MVAQASKAESWGTWIRVGFTQGVLVLGCSHFRPCCGTKLAVSFPSLQRSYNHPFMFKLETLVDVVALVSASKRQRAVLWQDPSGNWHPLYQATISSPASTPWPTSFAPGALPKGRPHRNPGGESLGVAGRRLRDPGARRRRCPHLSHPDPRPNRRPAQSIPALASSWCH